MNIFWEFQKLFRNLSAAMNTSTRCHLKFKASANIGKHHNQKRMLQHNRILHEAGAYDSSYDI